ncbi:hypothetical protein EJ08DRAFT_652383 [Tothia fuscella]|uniref:Uncharacterized protein n=1 Tax=Tothia fuscella TaxID=1048955 RepID=A0A9P4NK41_9PEZI|nr:hypothetical protein EJ08DRAFT_652383 [Tothia fuscella]
MQAEYDLKDTESHLEVTPESVSTTRFETPGTSNPKPPSEIEIDHRITGLHIGPPPGYQPPQIYPHDDPLTEDLPLDYESPEIVISPPHYDTYLYRYIQVQAIDRAFETRIHQWEDYYDHLWHPAEKETLFEHLSQGIDVAFATLRGITRHLEL